jgi:hypothetical protein
MYYHAAGNSVLELDIRGLLEPSSSSTRIVVHFSLSLFLLIGYPVMFLIGLGFFAVKDAMPGNHDHVATVCVIGILGWMFFSFHAHLQAKRIRRLFNKAINEEIQEHIG